MNSSHDPLALRALVAAYKRGLGIYPGGFRSRFATDLVEAFSDDMEARYARRGVRGLLTALPGTIRDLLTQSIRERLENSGFGKPTGSGLHHRPKSPHRPVTQMISSVIQDVRFAARMLTRAPAFSLIVIVTLALGIGATTAVFTTVNAIAFRPLPFTSPEELVLIWYTEKGQPQVRGAVGAVNVADWQAMNGSFSDIGMWRGWRATLAGVDVPQSLLGARISHQYARALDIQPLYGRVLGPEDDLVGAPNRVMLSYEVWQQQFGAAQDVLGTSLRLNGAEWEIIGILEPGFSMPRRAQTEVIAALRADVSQTNRGSHNLNALARLAPGVSLEAARADMRRIDESLEAQYPETNLDMRSWVRPLHEDTISDVSVSLYTLLVAVGFVLLVAVANVASLLVARTTAREEELAIRAALGAGRGRIVRQLLSESLLLAVLGGAVGLVLAHWGTRALLSAAPASIPRLSEVSVDYGALAFASFVTLASGLLFGTIPALRRRGSAESLRGARGTTALGAERLRRTLVVGQVAVALVLLIGAGLLINSFARLLREDPGMQPDGVLAARLALGSEYSGSEAHQAFFADLIDRIRARPEVDEAGAVFLMPFAGGSVSGSFGIPARPAPEPGEEPGSYVQAVSSNYFELLRTPLLRGRNFAPTDDWAGDRVAIINETAARLFWPGEDPLGEILRLHVTLDSQERDLERTIVGVVANAQQWSLDGDDEPFIYVPFRQYPVESMYLMTRPHGAPADFAPTLRQIVKDADPGLALYRVGELSDFLGRTVERQRFSMFILGGFAAFALVLGCVGIYGLIAFNVARRTREIGLRMAIGASGASVLMLVLRETSRMVGLGIALGIAASLALTRLIASMLHDVSSTDTATITVMTLLLGAFALVAGLLPARRAARVHPSVALRAD